MLTQTQEVERDKTNLAVSLIDAIAARRVIIKAYNKLRETMPDLPKLESDYFSVELYNNPWSFDESGFFTFNAGQIPRTHYSLNEKDIIIQLTKLCWVFFFRDIDSNYSCLVLDDHDRVPYDSDDVFHKINLENYSDED